MKKIAAVFLTTQGGALARRIQETLPCDLFGKEDFPEGLSTFVKNNFLEYDAFLFIMAAGIAVRVIAPCIQNKYVDPAVLALDEKGQFVISLLSGHVGGANALALEVAAGIGAQPVVTTATDLNHVVAFDLFAKEQQCMIRNPACLKTVSGALAEGQAVGFFADGETVSLSSYLRYGEKKTVNVILSSKDTWTDPPLELSERGGAKGEETNLWLCPKNLAIGIGCKKGTPQADIEEAVFDFLQKQNRRIEGVRCVASIVQKQGEQGILSFCKAYNIPFVTYPKEKLLEKEAACHTSPFVKKTVGVGSVCEASVLCAGEGVRLLQEKTIYRGITLALGEILLMWKI